MNDLVDTTEMYLRTIYDLEEEGVVPLRARIAERQLTDVGVAPVTLVAQVVDTEFGPQLGTGLPAGNEIDDRRRRRHEERRSTEVDMALVAEVSRAYRRHALPRCRSPGEAEHGLQWLHVVQGAARDVVFAARGVEAGFDCEVPQRVA